MSKPPIPLYINHVEPKKRGYIGVLILLFIIVLAFVYWRFNRKENEQKTS